MRTSKMHSGANEKQGDIEQKRFTRVAEGVYRYQSGGFYLRAKVAGRPTWHKLKSLDLQAARREARDFLRTGKPIDKAAAKRTVADFARAIVAEYPEDTGTRKNRDGQLAKVLAHWPGGADTPISNVRPGAIRDFMQSAAHGSSGSYYNDLLGFVRKAFQRALVDHAIGRLPDTEGDESVWKRRRYKPKAARIPTVADWRAIVADIRAQEFSASAEEAADFVEAEGALGLGQAELAALLWADVNLDRGEISVRRVKTGEPFTIPIYPQARALLERRRNAIEGTAAADSRVFGISDPKAALTHACDRLKLPRYSQRTFRKMFITEALRRGVNVKTIASLQGHVDGGKLILQTYSAAIGEGERTAAAQIIGEAFK